MINGNGSPHAVLIVEDDQLLMALTAGIVEDAGFEAIQAGNADQAVAILKERSDIALLLTDIDMPGSMDGVKLAHAVRDRWPPIKIIVVSSRVPDRDLPAGSRFFCKPYHAGAMILEMRSLLGREMELQPKPARAYQARINELACQNLTQPMLLLGSSIK